MVINVILHFIYALVTADCQVSIQPKPNVQVSFVSTLQKLFYPEEVLAKTPQSYQKFHVSLNAFIEPGLDVKWSNTLIGHYICTDLLSLRTHVTRAFCLFKTIMFLHVSWIKVCALQLLTRSHSKCVGIKRSYSG